jgi:hypothetical protein
MPLKDQRGKKNKLGMGCTIIIDFFKDLKKMVTLGNLVDFPTQRVGGSVFEYEYLPVEAKIETVQMVVSGPMPTLFMQKHWKNWLIAMSL